MKLAKREEDGRTKLNLFIRSDRETGRVAAS